MDSINQNNPLVSIIVITYNSSKYVLETLESAKGQTYHNIELIISDDASHDDTVQICENWLSQNRDRFIRTDLITVINNTGIASNCNRGVNSSKGEWIKLIAGDDLLIKSSIQDYITYSLENPNAKIIFARLKVLKNNVISNDEKISIFDKNQIDQTKLILKGSGLKAPTSFIQRALIFKVGGFDEKYPMIEDLPMWVKLTLNKYKFYSTDTFTVIYRIHESNVSFSNERYRYLNGQYYRDLRLFFLQLNPVLVKKKLYITLLNNFNEIIVKDLIVLMGNKKNLLTKFISLFFIKSTINSFIFFLKKSLFTLTNKIK